MEKPFQVALFGHVVAGLLGRMPRTSTQPLPEITEALIGLVQGEGRVCPMPQAWDRLFSLIPRRIPFSGPSQPPFPLVLASWGQTTDGEKRGRFLDHIRFAAAHGGLGRVSSYIRLMDSEDWYYGLHREAPVAVESY